MFLWFYDLPNWLTVIIFTVASVALSCAGVILLRKPVQSWMQPAEACNNLVGWFLGAYGVFYGLMIGLIAVGTYENFSQCSAVVGAEATALGALYRDVSVLPHPVDTDLENLARKYCNYVVDEAWPQQIRGIRPEGGTRIVTEFHERLVSFEPKSNNEIALYSQALSQFNAFVEARRARLESVDTSLPAEIWYVVLVGAIGNMVLTWLFVVDKLSVHLVLAGLLSLFVGLLIFLVVALDHPYRGEFCVSPEPFEIIRDTLMNTPLA